MKKKAKKTKTSAKPPVKRKTKTAKTRKLTAKRKSTMSNDTTHNQSQASTPRAADRPTGALHVTRTELVWPGKYNDDGTRKEVPRVSLPFQVIETVNESQATRQAKKATGPTLFDLYEGDEGDTFDTGWKNKLIWGDNLLVTGSLLEKFAGEIDLIYIDPPFATGLDFSFVTEMGDDVFVPKQQSLLEEKAYRDTWGRGIPSFLDMLHSRLQLMCDLLAPNGSIYVHIGPQMNHYVRLILDDVFGREFEQREIIWKRVSSRSHGKYYPATHDAILFYSKSDSLIWNQLYEPLDQAYVDSKYRFADSDGRKYRKDNCLNQNRNRPNLTYEWNGHVRTWRWTKEKMQDLHDQGRLIYTRTGVPEYKRYLDESDGVAIQSIWTDIRPVNSQADEDTGYDTQKPESLVDRIIRASSQPGDLVADFFCGSGTTLAVAEKLGRRWVGCDMSRWAMHVSRKRLLEIEGSKPFEILNLGKYERQYWQGVTFASQDKHFTEQALYEYLAFILRLYGAQPVAGMAHLHGKKGRGMVHIGAVDAPVTIDEINLAIEECAKLKQTELHVLGWEWEMGLYDLMVAEAKKRGVKLLLLQIPREVMEQQAVDKGDISFFELAYLEILVKTPKKLTATVTLKDFVIPNTELIPDEVRAKVKKWSDYVDYWAVDWNFQNDTFLQGWVTYRTRDDRTLALTSDPHTYEQKGKYRVLVKVIDIFGNDTSQAFDVEVK